MTYFLKKLRVPILLSFHHPVSSKEKRYLQLKNTATLNNARSLRTCNSTSLSLCLYFFPSHFYVIPGMRLDLQYEIYNMELKSRRRVIDMIEGPME